MRAALLKLCSMLQTTGLGPGLIRAAERTSPQPGWLGQALSLRYNTRQWALPAPPTTTVPSDAWVGSPKWSRYGASRPFLRESGIELAITAAGVAPLSRGTAVVSWMPRGSSAAFGARTPRGRPSHPGARGIQGSRRCFAQAMYATLRIIAQRIWAARATDGLSFDARIMRTPNPAAAPDDPRTQDQRDVTRCRVECD